MADVRTCTGYEPKDLAENDDLCVKPVFFHRPSISWTYDSAENIATPPPDSDLDDEQIRALLASRLYLKGEKQVRTERENLVSSSSEVPKSSEKPVPLFSSKRKSSPETFIF